MPAVEPAAVMRAAGDVRIEQREVPVPGERELLVEVAAVGICGSDVHYFEHGRLGNNVVRAPHILGHEVSGRVVEHGPRADAERLGQRVTIEPGMACGTCSECSAGRYNLCEQMEFLGAPPVDGALRGHIAIDGALAFELPDALSYEAGALIEPLAVAVWACRRAEVGSGDRVLVTGAGPIGLLIAQVAARRGATEVTIVDLNEHRLSFARRIGIAQAISPDQLRRAKRRRVDVVIECTGSAAALADAVPLVRPGGTVVVVGMTPGGSISLPLEYLQRRELTVTGSFRYSGCFPEAIELAASGQIELERLITGRYPLTEVQSALGAARKDPTQVKAVVVAVGHD